MSSHERSYSRGRSFCGGPLCGRWGCLLSDCQGGSAHVAARGVRHAFVSTSFGPYDPSTYVPGPAHVAKHPDRYRRNSGLEREGRGAAARNSLLGHRNPRNSSCCVTTRAARTGRSRREGWTWQQPAYPAPCGPLPVGEHGVYARPLHAAGGLPPADGDAVELLTLGRLPAMQQP
jgi:hypothetical protein